MLGDNAPKPDGWQLPPRCCGEWAIDIHRCHICGNNPTPAIPQNIELSDN